VVEFGHLILTPMSFGRYIKKMTPDIFIDLKKKLVRKRVIVAIILVLMLPTVGKYLCFEFLTDVPALRNHIGKDVVYLKGDGPPIEGVLKKCRYELNDKFGWFSLRVEIEGRRQQLNFDQTPSTYTAGSFSFSVFDVKKIERVKNL